MSSIKLSPNASGTGIFTIASPNSNTDRTLTLPDNTGTILTTGTAGVPVNGPAFSAYISGSSQSVTGSTWTKLACNAEEFDTNSCFDSTTNYRFTPNVAGYYQVTMGFSVSGGYTGLVTGGIYKNGSLYKQIIYQNSTWYINAGTCLVYCNGTTDYVEAYGYLGANGSFVASQSASYFQGCMVRSA